VNVMLGNEEDFSAALGYEIAGTDQHLSALDPENFKKMLAMTTPSDTSVATLEEVLQVMKEGVQNASACFVGCRADRWNPSSNFHSGFCNNFQNGRASNELACTNQFSRCRFADWLCGPSTDLQG
jgi:hypothetical protein